MNRLSPKLSFIVFVLIMTGCVTNEPYDYTNLRASNPRSILVLPPINNTVEVGAPYTFIATISKPLAEKGYYVFPVAVIDTFLKENGLPTPAEMNAIPLDKLQQHTGADAVLYVTINDWGQKYEVVESSLVIDSSAKLLHAKTGTVLWETRFYFDHSSYDGNGGLTGALAGALITQIAGTLDDKSPQASSTANTLAINDPSRGLLTGPYSVVIDEPIDN